MLLFEHGAEIDVSDREAPPPLKPRFRGLMIP